MPPRRATGGPATRGSITPADAAVGFLLCFGLPALALLMRDVIFPPPAPRPRTQLKIDFVPPDAEEVGLQLELCRRVIDANAAAFLDRAGETTGRRRIQEMSWSRKALEAVRGRLAELAATIERDPRTATGLAGELGSVNTMRAEVDGRILDVSRREALGSVGQPGSS